MDCHCSNCSYRKMVFAPDEDTELHRLVTCKDAKLRSIRKLLKKENLNARDANKDTPLHLATIIENNPEILSELISAGAEVNVRNLVRNTPLHVAALHYNTRAAEALLQSGAFVNSKNAFGNTPLHLAVMSSLHRTLESGSKVPKQLMVEKLIKAGADVNLTNIQNETPLYRAVKMGDFDAVKELLKSGANVNICNCESSSCLHAALCELNFDQRLVEELVKNGANISYKDNWFRTPLDLAILRHINDPSDGLKSAMMLIKIGVLVHPEISIDICRIGEEAISNSLNEFYEVCSSVVKQMKALKITNTISLHDFALRGTNCSVLSCNNMELKIYSKVLQALLKRNLYPYDDIIESYFPKPYLRKVLMNIKIVTYSEENQREIMLVSDVVWLISYYLNQTDMLRLIKASIVEFNVLS